MDGIPYLALVEGGRKDRVLLSGNKLAAGPAVEGQRQAAPRRGREKGSVESVDMSPNVARGLQKGRTVPKEGDGVAATLTIGDDLEISGVRVALKDPFFVPRTHQ